MAHAGTVFGLFLMLMVGYGCKKFHLLKEENSQILNKIILNITLPCFLLAHLLGKEYAANMFKTPFAYYVIAIITMIIAYLICRALKLSEKLTYAILLTAGFANTGYLGYPIIEAIYKGNPQALPTAVIVDQFGMSLLLNICAPILAFFLIKDKKHDKPLYMDLLNVLRTPVMIATIFGLVFHDLQLPSFIIEPLNRFSDSTIPLVMIAIGLKMKPVQAPKYVIPVLIVFILKMILQPILMHFGLPLIVHEKFIIDIATIQIGLSPAMVTSIYIETYNGDANFSSAVIFVCTMLTVFTVPLTAIILGL